MLHYLSYFYRIWFLASMMADFNYIITFVLDVEFLEVDVVKKISVTTPYHSVSLSFKPPRPWNDLTREEQLEYKNNNNTLNVPWDEGAIDYKELRNAVYTLIPPGVMKYAKECKSATFSLVFSFSKFTIWRTWAALTPLQSSI